MAKLSLIPAPFLVSVVCEPEPLAVMAAINNSQSAGAEAVELNLAQCENRYLKELSGLLAQTRIPIYTTCRRREFMAIYGFDPQRLEPLTDRERMDRQLQLLGPSVAVDMEFDTFAEAGARPLPALPPSTQECARSEASVRKQEEIMGHVHRRGFEVVLSCHAGTMLTATETLALAREMERRGADLVKIILQVSDPAENAEVWKAILAVRSALTCPFVISALGPGSGLLRRIGCHLGCGYTFCRPDKADHIFPGHPSVTEMRQLFSCFPPSVSLKDLIVPRATDSQAG